MRENMLRIGGFLTIFLQIVNGIARFEPVSVTDSSLVIKMIKAGNVSRFDMIVHIYDLEKLSEFRKTELVGSTKDQLFSFDGLLPSTWFAFRIHYRLVFQNVTDYTDVSTKQELIIKTKDTSRQNPEKIDDSIAFIEETFVSPEHVYVSIKSVFTDNKKVITVIVPEMRCKKGILKPLAQQVIHNARFHFDVSQLGEKTKHCTQMCIFPFLRVAIHNRTSETFRGKEWCGSVEEAHRLGTNSVPTSSSIFNVIISLTMLFGLFLL